MRTLILLLGLFIGISLNAQPYESLEAGNKAYSEGNYTKAIDKYNEVLKLGYIAPEVFYNLGNSYYRTENYSKAILNFHRAGQLSPNDEDIKFNLHISFLKVSAKNELKPELTVNKWLRDLRLFASSDFWAVFSIVSFVLLLALLAIFLFSGNILIKKITLIGSVLGLVLTVMAFLFSFQRKNDITAYNTAVVSEPTITVKSSPDVNGNDVYIIYEGTLVQVIDSIQGWKNVSLQNGEVGWIPAKTVVELTTE